MKYKKILIILVVFIVSVSVLISLYSENNKKKEISMIKDIDISQLKIDHLVVNVDGKYQENEGDVQEIRSAGFPYLPAQGKSTGGFKVSNIWIGEEYFELVRVKNEDGGGWIPDWVERYNSGQRGMVCLFLDTDDMESLYAKLKDENMSEPEKMKYKFLFNLFTFSPPWKNAYLPYFEGAPFQIGFQQLDSEKTREKLYEKMTPNSNENKISGIKRIEIYGNFTKEDWRMISEIFTTTERNEMLTWKMKDGQALSFIMAEEYLVKVYVEKENDVPNGNVMIENVEIIVA